MTIDTKPSALDGVFIDPQGRGEGFHLRAARHSDIEKPPRWNVPSFIKLHNRLLTVLREYWIGEAVSPAMIEDDVLPELVDLVPARVAEALRETLRLHLLNRTMTRDLWDFLCSRISGNIYDCGRDSSRWPLTPSTDLRHRDWALVQIAGASLVRSSGGHVGGRFTYKVRTGFAAGTYFKQFLPLGYLVTYGNELGYGKAKWHRQPRLYVGAHSLAFLDPADIPSRLRFSRFHASASCKRINRFFAEGRTNPCINGYVQRCWDCPLGYSGENACKYATHKLPWVKRNCPRGHIGWFEPHWPSGSLCRLCREQPLRALE